LSKIRRHGDIIPKLNKSDVYHRAAVVASVAMILAELETFRFTLREWADFQITGDDDTRRMLTESKIILEPIQDVRPSEINARLLKPSAYQITGAAGKSSAR
jgi:hypothetical protein